MDWVSVLIMALKFLFSELPTLIEEYKNLQKDKRYERESDRIDAAIKAYKSSKSRSDKLDRLKELER